MKNTCIWINLVNYTIDLIHCFSAEIKNKWSYPNGISLDMMDEDDSKSSTEKHWPIKWPTKNIDFSTNESIERFHLTFYKILEMLTPSYMIYGKLGCYTMDIDIKVRTLSRLLTSKQSKLFFIYKCMYYFSLGDNINFDWIKYVNMCTW